MTFQKIIRMRAMMTGLAAALFMANAVSAQEITNTAFDDGPNVAPFEQSVPAQATGSLPTAVAVPQSVPPVAAMTSAVATLQADIKQLSSPRLLVSVSFLVCLGLAGIYVLAGAKRSNRASTFTYTRARPA